jgi:hypothetical protein
MFWSILGVDMAAKGWHKNENSKFQSKSLAPGQFGQFYSAGPSGPVSSESLKNPAESSIVVTLLALFGAPGNSGISPHTVLAIQV